MFVRVGNQQHLRCNDYGDGEHGSQLALATCHRVMISKHSVDGRCVTSLRPQFAPSYRADVVVGNSVMLALASDECAKGLVQQKDIQCDDDAGNAPGGHGGSSFVDQ